MNTNPNRYEIEIRGELPSDWAVWFDGLMVRQTAGGQTILSGEIIDQAALYGVFKKIRNLGLTLISVNPESENKAYRNHIMNKKIKVFVAGGTGATGRLLIAQLLERGHTVKTVVRSAARLPESVQNHPNLLVTEASLLDLNDAQLAQQVAGCDAVASCLGHNLSFKGIWGHPRRLVTDAVRRLAQAVVANRPTHKTKFVLMNTVGNKNRDLDESLSFGDAAVVGLLRRVLPPQADNEAAADYLRVDIGQDHDLIEWVAVRPDGLIDETAVTPYELHPSPIRGVVFDSGQTSRINVAHFMAELMVDEPCWEMWRGQMPAVYNRA